MKKIIIIVFLLSLNFLSAESFLEQEITNTDHNNQDDIYDFNNNIDNSLEGKIRELKLQIEILKERIGFLINLNIAKNNGFFDTKKIITIDGNTAQQWKTTSDSKEIKLSDFEKRINDNVLSEEASACFVLDLSKNNDLQADADNKLKLFFDCLEKKNPHSSQVNEFKKLVIKYDSSFYSESEEFYNKLEKKEYSHTLEEKINRKQFEKLEKLLQNKSFKKEYKKILKKLGFKNIINTDYSIGIINKNSYFKYTNNKLKGAWEEKVQILPLFQTLGWMTVNNDNKDPKVYTNSTLHSISSSDEFIKMSFGNIIKIPFQRISYIGFEDIENNTPEIVLDKKNPSGQIILYIDGQKNSLPARLSINEYNKNNNNLKEKHLKSNVQYLDENIYKHTFIVTFSKEEIEKLSRGMKYSGNNYATAEFDLNIDYRKDIGENIVLFNLFNIPIGFKS